jgi:hypothetical protein|uniref:TLC domain-containing protein n=1 Tax=Haptolina ericina TaxID=156174 RepID=A0A7S3BST3_9EUKA|mmetsp:Transcript_67366/g.150334  ORF Transcript_67366/g.150334 Transcript_67366/m.150334 type:complete len:142 (+) Transcript_67366:550-975(+)
MGVAELSSIPLTAYDQYERSCEIATSLPEEELDPQSKKRMRSVRDTLRTIAAVTFVLVRAIDFTRVTMVKFVPDAVAMLRSPATAAAFVLPLRFMLVSSVCFVCLQLYWFSMFVRISLAQSAREKKKREKRMKKEQADPKA